MEAIPISNYDGFDNGFLIDLETSVMPAFSLSSQQNKLNEASPMNNCEDKRRFNKGRFPKKELNLDLLRQECIKETSEKELMRIFNCSKPTIQRNIKKYISKRYWRKNWQRNSWNPYNKRIRKLYLKNKLSTEEISPIIGWCAEKVRTRLILLGIERRKKGFVDLSRKHPISFSNNPDSYPHTDAKLLNKQIKKLYLETGSMQSVASHLGIDRDTVRRRLDFMNVSRIILKRNEKRNNEIVLLYNAGKSSYAIGRKMNLSGSAVLRVLHNSGVNVRKKTQKDYLDDTVLCNQIKIMYLDNKMSIEKIAEKLVVCWETVKRHMDAMGIKLKRYNNFDKQHEFNQKVREFYVGRKLTGHKTADVLDCSSPKVYKRLKYLGIKPRNASQYFSDEKIKKHKRVIFWYNKNLKIASVSKIEKIPASTIHYILKRNNVRMRKRTKETQNRKDIVKIALKHSERYRNYADMQILKKEKKKNMLAVKDGILDDCIQEMKFAEACI